MSQHVDVKNLLDQMLSQLKDVQSYVLYVLDPFWDGELRLVQMSGVKVQEPMHGFLYPSSSRERIADGSEFEWVDDAQTDWRLTDKFEAPLEHLAEENELFGGFSRREHTVSCARLIRRLQSGEQTPDAVLFVNFTKPRSNDAEKGDSERILRETMDELAKELPTIKSNLESRSTLTLRRLPKVLEPTERLARSDFGDLHAPATLRAYFHAVLESLMSALDVEDGVGTIHLYDESTHDLTLQAYIGTTVKIPKKQSAANGEGVIAWVALKKRALLIHDLETSRFKDISITVRDGIRSELAVPMVLHDRIYGVLNLESSEVGHFAPEHVRAVWYAANQATISCQLCRQTTSTHVLQDRLQSLLHVCREAADRKDASPLDELAEIFRNWVDADMCDLWRYNSRTSEFGSAGKSKLEPHLAMQPRQAGWSRYAIREMCPVWIHDIRSPSDYAVQVWGQDSGEWTPTESETGPPELHESLDPLCQHE